MSGYAHKLRQRLAAEALQQQQQQQHAGQQHNKHSSNPLVDAPRSSPADADHLEDAHTPGGVSSSSNGAGGFFTPTLAATPVASQGAIEDLRQALQVQIKRTARAEARVASLETKVLELATLLLSVQQTSEQALACAQERGDAEAGLREGLLATQRRVAAFEAQLAGAVRALADAASAQRCSVPAAAATKTAPAVAPASAAHAAGVTVAAAAAAAEGSPERHSSSGGACSGGDDTTAAARGPSSASVRGAADAQAVHQTSHMVTGSVTGATTAATTTTAEQAAAEAVSGAGAVAAAGAAALAAYAAADGPADDGAGDENEEEGADEEASASNVSSTATATAVWMQQPSERQHRGQQAKASEIALQQASSSASDAAASAAAAAAASVAAATISHVSLGGGGSGGPKSSGGAAAASPGPWTPSHAAAGAHAFGEDDGDGDPPDTHPRSVLRALDRLAGEPPATAALLLPSRATAAPGQRAAEASGAGGGAGTPQCLPGVGKWSGGGGSLRWRELLDAPSPFRELNAGGAGGSGLVEGGMAAAAAAFGCSTSSGVGAVLGCRPAQQQQQQQQMLPGTATMALSPLLASKSATSPATVMASSAERRRERLRLLQWQIGALQVSEQ